MSLFISDEAIKEVTKWPHWGDPLAMPTYRKIAKAQLKHTLEQLEKEQLLKHGHSPNIVNVKPCRACAALREVGA